MTTHRLPASATEQELRSDSHAQQASGNWFQQHPRLVDLTVLLAIFVYNLPIQFGSVPDHLWSGVGLLISLLLCTPYVWRRRHPLGVFLTIQAAAVLQLVLGIGIIAADLMLLLVVYNVASRSAWYISASAAAGVTAWLCVAVVPAMREEHLSIGDVGVLIGAVIWAWTWGRLVQIRRRYIENLRLQAEQLAREKEAQATIIAASERARIAREIHDIVSHSLSVVVVMSDGAASKVTSEPKRAQEAMLAVRDTGRTALADMRRMLSVLRDGEPGSHAPQPGVNQLDELVATSKKAGTPVVLTIEGEPVDLAASIDLAVFRVVQEALTNVRKHAGTAVTEVSVRVTYRPSEIEVTIRDNGAGTPSAPDAGGHGLVGMRERLTAHGGSMRAGPRLEGGYEVVARLPLGGER